MLLRRKTLCELWNALPVWL